MGWRTTPELWARLRSLAREHRHEPTPQEQKLWTRVRDRQIRDAKFRRQHAIDRFIADFYCREASLVLEVDGPIHQRQQGDDRLRDEFFQMNGLQVLRFTNDEVDRDIQSVIRRIEQALSGSGLE